MSENSQRGSNSQDYARTMQPSNTLQSEDAYVRRLSSPIGRIELTSDGTNVTGLAIEHSGSLPRDDEDERPCAVLNEAAKQLAEYFSGTRRSFELPLSAAGTDFQRSVWQ